jgi:acyl-coenzyme A thioesterase PaaI-like protein
LCERIAAIQATASLPIHFGVTLHGDREGAEVQIARTATKRSKVQGLKSKVDRPLLTLDIGRWTLDIMEKSLQETYAPNMACFGCGPANEKGLHIRSFPEGNEVVATFDPETWQEAFPGILSGGIIGTLLDCHCNWTACYHLMKQAGAEHPPCTVTADYAIKLMRPTPTDEPIELRARVIESTAERAIVEGELIAHGKVCATCHGTFVAVKPGHPAYHRW